MGTNITQKLKSLRDLEIYFNSQRRCLDYLAWKRWEGSPQCPYCSGNKIYKKCDGRYVCAGCGNTFSILVGTVFQNTKLPLLTWFKAIFLVCNSRQGISSCQLSFILGVTQKTAWFILQKIRLLLRDSNDDFFDHVQGIIEVKMGKKGNPFKVRIPDSKHKIHPEVVKRVMNYSRVLKDDLICLQSLVESERPELKIEDPYPLFTRVHRPLRHVIVDSFWIQLKRMIAGIYHFVSASHFHRYVYEALFRRRHFRESNGNRFSNVFDNMEQVLPYSLISPHTL
ncbi:MAG: transposase [Bacteroidales bacterium]|nr:transposase [Bacteroidales bacterium]